MSQRLPKAVTDDPAAQAVLRIFADAGQRGLFVGGVVRNALLGMGATDIDIATDARPEHVIALAKAAGIRSVPTGIEHGTVTLVLDGRPFEVTTFRRDMETDGRHATVAFSKDVAEDARRRDFTINALYAEADGTIVDPLGGLADLKARRVRFVGEASDRIREDYLRILRFFRFTACYADPSEGMEPDGLAACAALADGLSRLSVERVWTEVKKLLGAPNPAWVVAPMETSGVLARCLPGTTAQALAPLVHAEETLSRPPDPLRRLVALGGDAPEKALRLSRAETRHLKLLRDALAVPLTPLALGFELGPDHARDVLALRYALMQSPFTHDDVAEIDKGAAAEFPVRAGDLPSTLQGPEIAAALTKLKTLWLSEGCALDKAGLLDRL